MNFCVDVIVVVCNTCVASTFGTFLLLLSLTATDVRVTCYCIRKILVSPWQCVVLHIDCILVVFSFS